MRENRHTKARRYLTEGRVYAEEIIGQRARFRVRGDGATYRVVFDGGDWHCSCPAQTRCCHRIAAGLVFAPEVQV